MDQFDSNPRLPAIGAEPTAPAVPAAFRWAVWAIERVGFPVLISLYLIFSLGPKFDRMAEKMDRLIVITEARK